MVDDPRRALKADRSFRGTSSCIFPFTMRALQSTAQVCRTSQEPQFASTEHASAMGPEARYPPRLGWFVGHRPRAQNQLAAAKGLLRLESSWKDLSYGSTGYPFALQPSRPPFRSLMRENPMASAR